MPGDDDASPIEVSCRCQHCGSADPAQPADNALRCACGSLLARFVHGKLELKCRRCKRTVMVALEHDADSSAD